jgi:hypothetical protein
LNSVGIAKRRYGIASSQMRCRIGTATTARPAEGEATRSCRRLSFRLWSETDAGPILVLVAEDEELVRFVVVEALPDTGLG